MSDPFKTPFTQAIVRKPGENFAQGLTTGTHVAADYTLMVKQHNAYVESLKSAGLAVTTLEPAPAYPDAHFVEDTAVVVPGLAVITNPGADSRKGEEKTIEPVLARHRNIAHIRTPGTLDGGDVLMTGRHFFIGISDRTNENGAHQLGGFLESCGYTWQTVPVVSGLHLKSSINYAGKNTLLITKAFADRSELAGYEKIITDNDETYACNTLFINNRLLMPAGYPKTKEKLKPLGF